MIMYTAFRDRGFPGEDGLGGGAPEERPLMPQTCGWLEMGGGASDVPLISQRPPSSETSTPEGAVYASRACSFILSACPHTPLCQRAAALGGKMRYAHSVKHARMARLMTAAAPLATHLGAA